MTACYNKDFSLKGIMFNDYMDGRPSRSLRLHQVWWSARTPQHPLTFFTPADMSRLPALQAQCRSLRGGIVSVAIWLPLVVRNRNGAVLPGEYLTGLEEASKALGDVFAKAEGANLQDGCVMRLLLLYELIVDEALAALMPINALRNAAMLATDSPLVAMVDVDLSVNEGLTSLLMNRKDRTAELMWRAERQHVAWVMPAWDPVHHMRFAARNDIADIAVSVPVEEKYRLRDMWVHRRLLYPFAMERGYLPGHTPTNYEKWFTSAVHYPVDFQEGYEPWFIAARKVMPFYDARFRGYYTNKLVATRYAARLLNMRVLTEVWLVHRPHNMTVSNRGWLHLHQNVSDSPLDKPMIINGSRITGREAFFERNREFYREAVVQMNEWAYTPVVDAAARHCRSVLSWWSRG